ncbi:hypothetical protein EBB59_03465 [Lysobacter pythonis]|uniref:ApeI dehydratase-like domain-containing protein n=1 Tax=Solilutibacter pythonis TaxID=2483112 RepID=A0A3M2I0M6_9GAMM|nr:hypothetical protein [Lysobacter pythonis]RMH93723.1 hypothetical protein EBB59_03465 [Lysobacter pythonis]
MSHHFVIPHAHPCLPGHFPGQPVVPGVVILDEALRALEARQGALPALRLPQVKFLQPLLPGQAARVELSEVAPRRWRFRVLRGDALIASGELAAA